MTVLDNHIYHNIIYIILKYLYPKNDIIGYKTPNHRIISTIDLALVSKKWFQYVSSNLTNRILNFRNHDDIFLNCFINVEFETKSDEYHLIKSFGSVKVYYTLMDYENDKENQEKYQYRKILVNVDNESNKELLPFLLSKKEYPSNVYFNLKIDENCSTYTYDFDRDIEENEPLGGNGGIISRNINEVEIYGHKLDYEDQHFFKTLIKLNPKSIRYFPNFDSSLDPIRPKLYNILNNISNLKYLYVRSSDVQLEDLANINTSKSKLKLLDITLRMHNYIFYLNGDHDIINYEEQQHNSTSSLIESKQDLINKWNSAIRTLSELKTLKYLIIAPSDFQGDVYSFSNYIIDNNNDNNNNNNNKYNNNNNNHNNNIITLGFKSLLLNPSSRINTLKLCSFDFIDQNIIDGLKLNKSINTLILDETESKEVIKQVLSVNRTISNLYFYDQITEDDDPIDYLNLLVDPGNQIELHSVFVGNDRFDYLKLYEIFQLLNENHFNIKEFYFNIDKEYKSFFKSQSIINNSLINVNKYL